MPASEPRAYKLAMVLVWALLGLIVLVPARGVRADSRGDTGTPEAKAVRQALRDSTVMVNREDDSGGTGSLVKKGDVTYLLTAGHVLGPQPEKGEWVMYVVEPVYENDDEVARFRYVADVLLYSAPEYQDLALLRVRKQDYGKATTRFYADEAPPGPDTEVLHCGNFMSVYHNVVRAGYVDQVGIRIPGFDRAFDMADVVSYPGSSGGPVVLKSNGLYVGMVTRGPGTNVSTYIPVRRIRAWAYGVEAGWLFDDSAVPDKYLPAWKRRQHKP